MINNLKKEIQKLNEHSRQLKIKFEESRTNIMNEITKELCDFKYLGELELDLRAIIEFDLVDFIITANRLLGTIRTIKNRNSTKQRWMNSKDA